jgi:GTP1/Obg family GTP-binding protein
MDYDFQQGLVFRDSRGHHLGEQSAIAADFEVKNKIFLIPIDNSGYLIDERYSNLFEKILISEPENNIFVLTKIDINTTYKKYKKSGYLNVNEFNREFAEKLAKTHDSMLYRFLVGD